MAKCFVFVNNVGEQKWNVAANGVYGPFADDKEMEAAIDRLNAPNSGWSLPLQVFIYEGEVRTLPMPKGKGQP